MKPAGIAFLAIGLIISLSFCGRGKKDVERVIVDGVTHVRNPEKPLRGMIVLEVDKVREIDPYKLPEVGLKYIQFARATDGEVILSDPNRSEAHRFSGTGDYLGGLSRKGQGPGEFPEFSGFSVSFRGAEIWISGAMKLARFNKKGELLAERKFTQRPEVFVQENIFFTSQMERTPEKSVQKILLKDLSDAQNPSEIQFFQAENVGMIFVPNQRAFAEAWATPRILSAYDPVTKRMNLALNTEYKIYVKNLKGETLLVIEKSHQNVRVGRADKEKLLDWTREDSSRWILDYYPDILVALKSLKMLPRGYLAAERVVGPKVVEIDVFDAEGRYFYALQPPAGLSLENAQYFASGFGTTIEREDGAMIYVEYKIKNLPEIFAQK